MSAAATPEIPAGHQIWPTVVRLVVIVVAVVAAVALVMLVGARTPLPWTWLGAAAILVAPATMLLYRIREKLPPTVTRLLAAAARKWPFIAWLIDQEEMKEQNAGLLEDFGGTLAEYGLEPIPSVEAARLAAWGWLLTPGGLARRFGGKADRPSRHAVELLHRERFGLSRMSLWLAVRTRLAGELATVVAASPRVPDAPNGKPHPPATIELFLRCQREFSVDLLALTLDALGELLRRGGSYCEFLAANGLAGSVPTIAGTGAKLVAEGRAPVSLVTIDRMRDPDLVLSVLEGCEAQGEPVELRVVARGVFLAEVDYDAARLRERVCRQALGQREAPTFLLAYLVDKEGRRPAVDLHDLWRGWVVKRARKGRKAELAQLRCDLQGGYWPTARPHIGRARKRLSLTPEAAVTRIETGLQALPQLTEKALRPDLRDLVLDAVDFARSLDALSDFYAYMITFDSIKGPMQPLVDCLANPAFEERLTTVGIRFRDDEGRQIYNFGPYTSQTRIGFARVGGLRERLRGEFMSFQELHKRLTEDFQTVLDHRTTLFPDRGLTGTESDFERMELTLNQIDIWHCRELLATTSIWNVFKAVARKATMDDNEKEALRRIIEHVERPAA